MPTSHSNETRADDLAAWLKWSGESPNTRYGSRLMDAFVAGRISLRTDQEAV